jgi:hypothetical protein
MTAAQVVMAHRLSEPSPDPLSSGPIGEGFLSTWQELPR